MAITGFDPARNFAIADLASGITSGATSATLATGKGALFPDPSADGAFNTVIYNSTDYTSPWEDPDAEIVRVTARSTDTLTITRAQEGTSAVAHNTGGKTYSLYMSFTQKPYDDIVAALTSGSDPDQFLRDTYLSVFTDNVDFILANSGTTIQMLRGGFVSNLCRRYVGGNSQQITAPTLYATANTASCLVVGGFAFALVGISGSSAYKLFRISQTGDISSAGNWTEITLSGASFSSASVRLIGYENSNFWFSDGSKYFKATLSGTTMTEGASVSVTGSGYNTINSRVNNNGIYAQFASAPEVRLADLSGNLVADAVVADIDSIFVTTSSLYASNSSTSEFSRITL